MISALHGRARLAPDEGLIGFHDAGCAVAVAAHGRKFAFPHGFADSVRKEPRCLVLNL